MPITVEPVLPQHIPTLAKICFEAFGALQDRHGVERDFDSVETAGMVVGLFASRPDFVGFIARDGGEILGSNFIGFSDEVAGVGPITIAPAAQSRGVGKLLMLAVMDEAKRRGIGQVRLMQEAINTTSLSLYTKLGFDWRECCSMMRPAAAAADDPRCRPVTEAELPVIDTISRRHYHASRVNEVAGFLKIGLPGFILRRDGKDAGYFFPGLLGHGFAQTPEDLADLVGHTVRNAPPQFHKLLLPLGQNDLHRTLMSRGGRTIKMFNYMSTGPYTPPVGAWMPSIGM
jgi:ribosomal protein S18 acetylase RimI-like enzyme